VRSWTIWSGREASMKPIVNAGAFFAFRRRRDAFDSAVAAPPSLAGARELHDQARRTLAGNSVDRARRAYDRGRTPEDPIAEFVALAPETQLAARILPAWKRSSSAARRSRAT
jgi:hypothetical protein